ncbi:hypothetical protein P5673_026041 [Acropora cervicornis]|uniref:Uncharacterized protein n=1 Tax=Acropora cervicornis TaxID=6130 RepID=A0AAD9UWL9_ACRCE|nr:hypothetical protein P5673_026041 [Acropora cervicornis]
MVKPTLLSLSMSCTIKHVQYLAGRHRAEADVEEVNSGPTDFKTEFPLLFTGLGQLKTECHITLRADAKPFCLYNPRKLPHPLLPKLAYELCAEEVEPPTTQVTASLPATAMRLQEIQGAQEVDEECSQVRVYSLQGWPADMPHQPLLRPY